MTTVIVHGFEFDSKDDVEKMFPSQVSHIQTKPKPFPKRFLEINRGEHWFQVDVYAHSADSGWRDIYGIVVEADIMNIVQIGAVPEGVPLYELVKKEQPRYNVDWHYYAYIPAVTAEEAEAEAKRLLTFDILKRFVELTT